MPAPPVAATAVEGRGIAVPILSVVLPVLNESHDLPTLLTRLRDQELNPGELEVIVSDGGSTDGTPELVQRLAAEWPALRLVHNPGRRSGPGRNAGARAARGRYILFLDGHCGLPRPDWIRRHIELFESTGADCLCRPQSLLAMARGSWAATIATARHSPLGHNPGSDIYSATPSFTTPDTAGAAYRRSVFEALDGYDERFDACEDVEFNHRVGRAGYTAYCHPDLRVDYRPRSTLSGLFGQMRRYGRGRAHLMARHGQVPLPLFALSAAGVTALALPFTLPAATGLTVSSWLIGAYLGILLLEGVRLAGLRPEAVRVAAALVTTHLGLLAGFWRGLLELHRFVAPRPSEAGRTAEPGHAR